MKALNDLNIFVETARQGSFSKAANSMDMTPAAISASIKRLEGQIGFPLFVRSTRSLRLTSEGELFLDKTTQALATLQEGL
ncbi:LysR family transcriptional regulator, partial [Salmonella enterica subsp. enterica serovar Derby]|nr:LysR family transcriptional regulator [Salmonella enterica subsp. enterica serovar Derby]